MRPKYLEEYFQHSVSHKKAFSSAVGFKENRDPQSTFASPFWERWLPVPGRAVGALGVIQGKTPLQEKYNSAQQFSGKGFLQFSC